MGFIFILIAAILDISANILIKKSNGFRLISYGSGGILLVLLAFATLSFSLKYTSLSIAYATWGALGILGTTLMSILFFQEKVNKTKIIGLVMMIGSIILLHL